MRLFRIVAIVVLVLSFAMPPTISTTHSTSYSGSTLLAVALSGV